jgi:hypothetical protein
MNLTFFQKIDYTEEEIVPNGNLRHVCGRVLSFLKPYWAYLILMCPKSDR